MRALEATLRVAALLPAHNEEKTIRDAIYDIVSQTYPVELIIVVNDCSTDKTEEILKELQKEIPRLVVINNEIPKLRAGAINCGLAYLKDMPIDLLMAADADSRFDKKLVEAALDFFRRFDLLGGVCSRSGVIGLEKTARPIFQRIESWLLWRIQRLDGAEFDATRMTAWKDVQILHGLCTVFCLEALINVGGYTSGHMLEDYELTLRLKKAGWRAMFCPEMKAWTKVPTTFKTFSRQRLRWMRGGMDVLLQYGINRFTLEDVFNHLLFMTLFIGIIVYVTIIMVLGKHWHVKFTTHPLPLALAGTSYCWSLYKLKYVDKLDAADVLIRVAVFPELCVAIVLSIFQLFAYYLSIWQRPQKW